MILEILNIYMKCFEHRINLLIKVESSVSTMAK